MPTSYSRSLKKQKKKTATKGDKPQLLGRGTNHVPSHYQLAMAYDSSKIVASPCSRINISTDCTLHYAHVVVLCTDDRAGIARASTNGQNKGPK